MSGQRLPHGGRINRDAPLNFSWDGQSFTGYQGDTLASALLASGERIFGRSFKYHRPRGLMSAGVEESGAIVTVGEGERTDPNVRATTQELYQGLAAFGQNAWPNVRFDLGGVNNLFSHFFAAGFYYKTFMGLPPFEWGRGTWLWMQYEKVIRRAAGMGEASRLPDPDHYEHAHAHCDVLVIGAGPAGLSAARCAAEAGLDVWLVEQDSEIGGDYLVNDPDAQLKQELAALASAGVNIMARTTAFGLYDNNVTGLLERVTDHLPNPDSRLPRHRFWTLRSNYTVVAAGALERGYAFGNNDRPGIMTANAARVYLNRYGVLAGQRILVSTNNDSAYATAGELAAAGAEVTLLDARGNVNQGLHDLLGNNVEHQPGQAVHRAHGVKGVVSADTCHQLADGRWQWNNKQECDLILVSGGWSPVVNLLSHRGIKPVWNAENACFVPTECSENISMAGSAAGIWTRPECIASGHDAGNNAVAAIKGTPANVSPVPIGGWTTPIQPLYEIKVIGEKLKGFVDFQHDVTCADVRLAHREGFVSVEHLKRYTTLGMANDQGKMGNILGIALMADALGRDIPEVGTTTFRPPYTPISIGALSGRSVGTHFRPLRRTPMHQWNLDQGGKMIDAGLWQRPWYFPRGGETISSAYIRETATTRKSVGLCDVTSLGKIAVQGPDATEFLNRIYTNPFAKLPIGKARYGIMLRDDGMVMDDGTTWRLGETEYFMTTTTAHAAKVMVWLEELLQTRWTDLRVHVTSVSEQWAGVAVAGPESRDTLNECVQDPAQISNEKLPFMGVVEATLKGGITCRIARISFSGEMAYEVYVPSDYGVAMMDLLWPVAQSRDGCLYGTEALGALRIEKGHVTGAELDGRVTIEDAGLGRMASNKKSYIGSALRKRPEMQRPDRPRLVGIFPVDKSLTFHAGAILCDSDKIEGHGEGWITGVTHSPELGHWIGLGFISGGHEAWYRKRVTAADPVRKGNIEVEIVSPHMVDPSGERMYG